MSRLVIVGQSDCDSDYLSRVPVEGNKPGSFRCMAFHNPELKRPTKRRHEPSLVAHLPPAANAAIASAPEASSTATTARMNLSAATPPCSRRLSAASYST